MSPLPVFVIARCEGWRACFWLFARICAAPLGVFVAVRRALVFLSARLVVRLLLRRVFLLSVGARFVLLAVVLPCFALFCCG